MCSLSSPLLRGLRSRFTGGGASAAGSPRGETESVLMLELVKLMELGLMGR